jgi:hypothetical protein
MGRDSSVGIATGYGLDGPGIESRWRRDFSNTSRTALGAHPASCTGFFPGVKRPGRGADHPPLLAPRSWKSRAKPLPRIWAFGSVTEYLYVDLKRMLSINTISTSNEEPPNMMVMIMMMMMIITVWEIFMETDSRSDIQGIPKHINRVLSASLSHMNPVHTFSPFLSNPL